MPDPIDIAEGRRLLDEADPAPWHVVQRPMATIVGDDGMGIAQPFSHNAALIVWARNNLPALLDQLETDRRALSLKLWRRLGDACDEVPPPNYTEDDYNAGVIEGLSRAQRIIRAFLAGDQ